MKKIIVRSQEELDAVDVDFDGRIMINFGTLCNSAKVHRRYRFPVEAWGNSRVDAWENSSVVARENSRVEAWGNSRVEAWGNSRVVARGNSRVEAWGNSSVEARGNSSVEARENSRVVAWGNSRVDAWENSRVVARGNSRVEAWGNSRVEAWGNSRVVARGNSRVEAWGNSSVEARGNSSVEARENSRVVAWGNSRVDAWENSSVVARENSRVEAWGNTQVVNAGRNANIVARGNARIVYNPSSVKEFAEANDIPIKNGKIKLYKAVHEIDGKYHSDWDTDFEYSIGDVAISNGFTSDPNEACGRGIHMATLSWAAAYGIDWDDLAILELEVDASEIVVPLYEPGKVRAPKALVLREVPLEEAGLIGEIIASRRA